MADENPDGTAGPADETPTHRDVPDSFDAPDVPPAPAVDPDPGYTAAGVPTFESVREKIENRYATSQGAAELDADTAEAHDREQQYEARQKAAAERLEQIRRSMHADGGT